MKREVEYEGRRYMVDNNEVLYCLSSHLPRINIFNLTSIQIENILKQPTINPSTGYPFEPHRFE
jgi:hypothetical protein